jgi:hypothetical protein
LSTWSSATTTLTLDETTAWYGINYTANYYAGSYIFTWNINGKAKIFISNSLNSGYSLVKSINMQERGYGYTTLNSITIGSEKQFINYYDYSANSTMFFSTNLFNSSASANYSDYFTYSGTIAPYKNIRIVTASGARY